jgi:predicted nucleotidyltransferase
MLPESIKNEIIENLRPLNPEKVILFGSYAYGSPTNESDVDLYIVTKDNYLPSSFSEKWI